KLRWNFPAPAAPRARPVDGEAALAERDRPAASALGTGRPRRARRPAVAAAGAAILAHRERHRHAPAEHRDAKRHFDYGLDGLGRACFIAPRAASEDRRK